jgi:cytochrome c peroxidase
MRAYPAANGMNAIRTGRAHGAAWANRPRRKGSWIAAIKSMLTDARWPVSASLCMAVVLSGILSGCGSRAASQASDAAASNPVPPVASALASSSAASAAIGVAKPQQGRSRADVYRQVRQITAVGKQMFFDPSLSGSGKLACASCHSPAYGMSPPNARSVQLGGLDMQQSGMRAAPSLKYLQIVPQFSEHYHENDDEGDESVDAGPTGGLTWDGRVDRGADQARIPLTARFEMASTRGQVVDAVRRAAYADQFRQAFGTDIFDDEQRAFDAVLKAFEIYEQSPADFYPYSSKYDAYLAGKAQLTAAERHGLALFNDERKGNCASCHISKPNESGSPPQFTDFGLIALGLPRNRALPVNRDPHFYDLGACGPERTDLKGRAEYCGIFRTPSLRNVALRNTFFHNGMVHSLEAAVRFYVERDTRPGKWYPRDARGRVLKFDDLPRQYWANVNTEPPFGGKPGDRPALSDAEIKDVVAFLGTLTDGYITGDGPSDPQRSAGIGQ